MQQCRKRRQLLLAALNALRASSDDVVASARGIACCSTEASDSPTPVLKLLAMRLRTSSTSSFVPACVCSSKTTSPDRTTGAFYVGATGDGTIYRGTLLNPNVTEFIPGGPGKEAVGMKAASGKLYVAGGFSGTVSVYDLATRQLSRRSRASAPACSMTSW